MTLSLPYFLVNGKPDVAISPLDRGFNYGDGVFETCMISFNTIPLWSFHRTRLLASAKRLLIEIDIVAIEQDIRSLLSQLPVQEFILKLVVSSGMGGRGYRRDGIRNSTVCIGIFAKPDHASRQQGVSTRICQLRLMHSTALAGLKHLSRLEHILARAEWTDEFDEGLLLNQRDELVEGTITNLFWIKGDKLFTPDLSEQGVSGVMRAVVMNHLIPQLGLDLQVGQFGVETLYCADEVFITNSTNGIWPVLSISDVGIKYFPRGALTQQLQLTLSMFVKNAKGLSCCDC